MKMKFFECIDEAAPHEKSGFLKTCGKLSFFLISIVFFSMCASLSASTYTWTGGGDGSSWSDSSNWSSGDGGSSYPNADDDTAEILSAASITLDADMTINELLIPSTNTEISDFSVTISSSTGKTLTVKSRIETFRPAGTGAAADATSTLVLDCDVGSPLMTLHSGGNVTISGGKTAIITNVTKTGGATPAYTLLVEGTLESTSIDLGSSDSASYSLSVSSSGVVQADSVSATVGSVKNEGAIELTGDFVLSDGNLVSTNSLKAKRIFVAGNSTLGGTIDTSSAASGTSQTYTGEVTLTGDTTIKCGASDVVFGAKVNGTTSGAQSLVVENTGEVTFSDTVGTTKALKSFSCGSGNVKFAGGANGNRIKAAGDISFGGTVSSDSLDMIEIISGGTVAASGAITVEKLLLRSLDSTSLATFNLDSVEHSVSKVACENCTELSLKTSGDIEVTSLTAWDSGSTVVNGIRASGDISLDAGSGGKIKLNYASSNTDTVLYTDSNGGVNFKSPVVLEKDSYIEADDGVFFDSSVDGGYVLGFTHNSNVVFSGNVGESTGLSGLDSWGPVKFNSGVSISVTGTAEFNAGFVSGSPLKLSGNAIIKKSNTLSDVSIDNSSFGSASTIEFESGETQTITENFAVKGSSGKNVTLDSIDSSGEWNVAFSTAPTNSDFEYVVVKNSKSETELSLFNDSDSISSDFSIADTDSSTTNWFSTVFYWIGTNSTSWLNASGGNWATDEGGANRLSANDYPSYSAGTAQIIISDSAVNELDVSDYASDVKISTLAIGSSSSDTTNEKTLVVLGSGNIDCSSTDSSSDLFVNHGFLKFTGAGRIRDSSFALIMDNDSGTVVYSTGSGTVTNYYESDDDTADYNDLVIESGEWTVSDNIKAASSFTVESGGTLELADGGEINSELTNKGTFKTETGASKIWADFTNESGGSVTVNGTLYIEENCSSVVDKGTWTFSGAGVVTFNNIPTSGLSFDASGADSSNTYKFNASAITANGLSFKGDSSNVMKISSFTDGSGKCSFENVEFTDDVEFAGPVDSSGSVKFDGNATFASDSDSALGGSVELESGKTLTNSGGGKVTISDFTENGSSVVNSGDGSVEIEKLTITSGSPESTFTGGGDSSKSITVSSAEYNSCDLSFNGFVNIVGGTAGKMANSGTVEITSGDMTISSLSNASGAKLSLSSGTFTVSGATSNEGTIVGGSGKITFKGDYDFTYSGTEGKLTASSSETEFNGSLVNLNKTKFTHNNGTVILNPSGDNLTIKGKTSAAEPAFNNLSATDLGGKTITVTDRLVVEGALSLSGTDTSSLLSISGEGSITLSESQETGEFLSVGEDVTIGIDPGDGSEATTTYTVWNSVPVGAIPYGWVFKLDYYWIGANGTSWTDAGNWAQKKRNGTVVAVSSAPTLDSSNPLYGKCSIYIQQPTIENKTISNWPELSADASFAELHVESTTNGSSTVTDDANLYLVGYGLAVSDAFSNTGNMHLHGSQLSSTATIVLPTDSSNVSENGTWYFFGNGSGTLSDIENLSYKNVVIEGSGNLASNSDSPGTYSVAAEKLTFNPAVSDSTGATLTLPSDASTIAVPSVVLDASGITTTIAASASSSFTISCTDGLSGEGSLAINGGSATVVEVGGAVSLESGDFTISGGKETTLGGNVTLSSGDFECSSATLNLKNTASGATSVDMKADSIIFSGKKITSEKSLNLDASSVFFSYGGEQTMKVTGSFTVECAVTANSKLTAECTGTAELHGISSGSGSVSLSATEVKLYSGDYRTTGAQTYKATKTDSATGLKLVKMIPENDGEWSASAITVNGSLDLDADGKTVSLSSPLTAGDFFFLSGTLNLTGSVKTQASSGGSGSFIVRGSSYNADDPRYSGTDTRFAYAGTGSALASSYASPYSASFGTLSGSLNVGGNFYVNGTNLNASSLSLSLPGNSDSKVTFNPSSSAAAGHWGADKYSAAVFNSTVSNVTVSSNSCVAAASGAEYQNVTDGGGNTSVYGSDGSVASTKGFAFVAPKITKAYSVYDDVLCVEFNVPIENSNGEITANCALSASLSSGGAWTGGGSVSLSDGVYSDPDCTTALKTTDTDITKIYLKTTSSWNTDATGTSSGASESTNRNGIHKDLTTDLSWLVGLFSAEYGHTMCEGYGADSYNTSAYTATEDHCSSVLVGVGTGQELHSKGTAQEYFDSHNFIEFVYSEPVDIGDLAYDAGDVNKQASSSFSSALEHGGAITDNADGVKVEGFATIESGSVKAGIKSSDGNGGWTGGLDSAKPHALYRKFALTAGGTSEIQSHRVRISVAGYVDEANPIGGYNNYLGYIESAAALGGEVTRITNDFITDKAVDSDGNELKNGCDGAGTTVHPLPTLTVNEKPDSSSSVSFAPGDSSLYTGWDTSAPVFAFYVDGEDYKFTDEDSGTRVYEIVGMPNSRSATYLYNVEIHFHDNSRSVYSDSGFSWLTRNGWQKDDAVAVAAPEYVGGSRMFESQDDVSSSNMTSGGIRKSSLDGASGAFTYSTTVGSTTSLVKNFNTTGITQSVLSNIFYTEGDTGSTTDDDGPYIAIPLSEDDQNGHLSVRTRFTIYYTPGTEDSPNSFITDLAGNRLVMVDSGDTKKTLQSIDISPPNFTLTLAPIGHDKIDIIFSKELYFKGSKLASLKDSGGLEDALDRIKSNMKVSGNASFSIENLEFKGCGSDYTELVATLDREVSLDDIPGTYIELDNSGLSDISGYQSYIQDSFGNFLENSTKHIISDFAVNAVDALYAYTAPDEDETEEDWFSSKGIYGNSEGATEAELYSVHDFSADSGNYGKLREKKDIVLVVSYDGDGSSLELIPDLKSEIDSRWVSTNINTQLGVSWRIWLPELLTSMSPSYNDSPLESEFPVAGENSGEWAYTFENDEGEADSRNWKTGDEVQFLFKIGSTEIDHDGDGTNVTGFYSFSMPESRIKSGDFSFLDLWSFHFGSIKSQRGGVSILNNVINSTVKETTVVKVDMPSDGILNVYVMTLDGNVIKRLAKGKTTAGTHYYKWDGTNNAGKAVARGMYFVRVSGKGIDETRKVMVVK